jgi:hypothetical protein
VRPGSWAGCHIRATANAEKRAGAHAALVRRLDGDKVVIAIIGGVCARGLRGAKWQVHERGVVLSSPSRVPDASLEPPPRQPHLASVWWAVRRTALWLAILFVMVVLGAWLFYASIDVDEAAASAPPASETAPPPR